MWESLVGSHNSSCIKKFMEVRKIDELTIRNFLPKVHSNWRESRNEIIPCTGKLTLDGNLMKAHHVEGRAQEAVFTSEKISVHTHRNSMNLMNPTKSFSCRSYFPIILYSCGTIRMKWMLQSWFLEMIKLWGNSINQHWIHSFEIHNLLKLEHLLMIENSLHCKIVKCNFLLEQNDLLNAF